MDEPVTTAAQRGSAKTARIPIKVLADTKPHVEWGVERSWLQEVHIINSSREFSEFLGLANSSAVEHVEEIANELQFVPFGHVP